MKTDLFVITGSEGVGKSTIVQALQSELGDKFVVYDFDLILRPYDLNDSWAEEVLTKLFHNVIENISVNKVTVVAGLIRPYQLQKVAQKFKIHNIKLMLIDISLDEQTKRLIARKGKTNLKGENDELVAFREFIKESKYDYQFLNTTSLVIKEITTKIKQWILEN